MARLWGLCLLQLLLLNIDVGNVYGQKDRDPIAVAAYLISAPKQGGQASAHMEGQWGFVSVRLHVCTYIHTYNTVTF